MSLLLLLALQATPLPAEPVPGAAAAPEAPRASLVDWESLAPLNYRTPPVVTPAMRGFVASEVAAGRCRPARDAAGRYTINLDVAVLVDGDGRILRTMPRAIDCPTVEQFGAGLALSFARENLLPRARRDDRWFRTGFVFAQP